jgi:flagellar motor switch protein FliN/FliY
MSDERNKFDLDELSDADEGQPRPNRMPALSADREGPDGWPPAPADSSPTPSPATGKADDLGAVYDIPVQLSAVLGKTTMPVSQLLRLGRGAVVELDRKVGESIDILVNNRLVARGEVVILDDRLGVTMTEIIKTET